MLQKNGAGKWKLSIKIMICLPMLVFWTMNGERVNKLTWHPWVTDTILGTKSWCYIEDEVFKPVTGHP